jgi:hypothetical protein
VATPNALSTRSQHVFAGASNKFKEVVSVSGTSKHGDDDENGNDRENGNAGRIKTVFVIAMENHNWTQPANQFTGGIQQIYQNINAPFINSLVNGNAFVALDGKEVNISHQVAYATAYHNVLATPSGNNPHIHPSEPSYIWAEAGDNFGVLNDNDP